MSQNNLRGQKHHLPLGMADKLSTSNSTNSQRTDIEECSVPIKEAKFHFYVIALFIICWDRSPKKTSPTIFKYCNAKWKFTISTTSSKLRNTKAFSKTLCLDNTRSGSHTIQDFGMFFFSKFLFSYWSWVAS